MPAVDGGHVARAIAPATSLAGTLDLPVRDTVVIQNSNTVALRLLPCDVFARTALVGQHVAAVEVQIVQALAAVTAPIASLDPRVEPRVDELDGFAVTFWTYYGRWLTGARRPTMQMRYIACMRRCETSTLRRRTAWNESRPLSVCWRTETKRRR